MWKKYIGLGLVLGSLGCSSSTVVECSYISKKSPSDQFEFAPQGMCGTLVNEDTLILYPEHFKNLAFSESNLTTIYTSGRVFYASPSGKVVRSFFFDNGADYFEEGLSRTIANGKFGFINQQLETVIAPQFDFAYPFEDSKSMVCQGCQQQKETNGEHTMIVGGKWGVIDKKGDIIVPLEYSLQGLYKKLESTH